MLMTITPASQTTTTDETVPAELPADVALVMSAMEAAAGPRVGADRRAGRRARVRTAAALRLYADRGRATVVYARDAGGRNVGFLSRGRLPLGYGGTIDLPGPDGQPTPIPCVVLRCTPTAGGFYDCCAAFNRAQPQFD